MTTSNNNANATISATSNNKGAAGANQGTMGINKEANQGIGSSLLANIERANFKDSIMIHVIDDSKNEKRDFTFSRSLLVKYMKYFDKCLKKISDQDEIDISIHCDAVIFEWLLNYIFSMEEYEKKQNGKLGSGWQLTVQKCDGNAKSAIQSYNGPKLDVKNAVTILISADFLKIDRLVKECLDFFVEHIEEISKVQVDMGCINSQIIREMARKVSLDRLNVLKERKDKLVSRLFMKKLELLLEKERNYLYKCAYCNNLFTMNQRTVLHCHKAKSYIDYNGQIRAKHIIDRTWDLKKFVTFVRETYRISWREIYWKVWSYLYIFRCKRCDIYYHIAEMGNCHMHKQQPKVKMSLHGPLGTNYQFGCCEKEFNVIQVLNQNTEPQNGCEVMVHEVSEPFQIDPAKEKKITDRIIAHQLIILETTGNKYIEKIQIREFNPEMAEDAQTIRLSENNNTPGSLVRPSSLNYKISLSEAVGDFIKKDMPLADDQFIDVNLEDPKASSKENGGNNSKSGQQEPEEFDDMMFDMTSAITVQVRNQVTNNPKILKPGQTSLNVQTPSQNINNNQEKVSYVNDSGQQKDAWFREEESMKKKLEKNAISQMKNRIAQQNRASGTKQPEPVNADQDSDVDPDERKPDNTEDANARSGPSNAGAVQLTSAQMEEAKQMTYGKMKQYRRDRLFASDFSRLENLQQHLKKNRVHDDQSQQFSLYGTSPSRKNNNNGQVVSKISPNKTGTSAVNQKGDVSQTNNGVQVMTQISAIYAKRSRSILNQFGQGSNQPSHVVPTNPSYLNPTANTGHQRNIAAGQSSAQHDHDKSSPRQLGRIHGSREKNYVTQGSAQAYSQQNSALQNAPSQSAPHSQGGHHPPSSSGQPSNGPTNSTMNNTSIVGSNIGGMTQNNLSMNTSSSFQQHENHDRNQLSSPNKQIGGSGQGNRPPVVMNQTGHGKNFPYQMHRKTNSNINKLPPVDKQAGGTSQ